MDIGKVDQAFNTYRTSAVAFTATIIVLSGAVIFALEGVSSGFALSAKVLLGLSSIGALIIQFLNVRGLYHHAQSLFQFNILESQYKPSEEAIPYEDLSPERKKLVDLFTEPIKKWIEEIKKKHSTSFERANKYFGYLDWLAPLSLVLCILGLISYGAVLLGL